VIREMAVITVTTTGWTTEESEFHSWITQGLPPRRSFRIWSSHSFLHKGYWDGNVSTKGKLQKNATYHLLPFTARIKSV
jgi:hypothetical protein